MKEDIRQKIIDHARTKYASSPHEFTEEEIGTIIDSECKCDRCGKSVFKLYDFPEIRDNEVKSITSRTKRMGNTSSSPSILPKSPNCPSACIGY